VFDWNCVEIGEPDEIIAKCESIGITVEQLREYYELIGSFPISRIKPKGMNILNVQKWSDFHASIGIDAHVSGILSLKHEKPAPQDVLYVASGFGFGPKLLNFLGYNVSGIDLDMNYVAEAIEKGGEVFQMDATNLLLTKELFDVTISRHFLCHGYLNDNDLLKALNEQYKILRKGGVLIHYTQFGDNYRNFGTGSQAIIPEDIVKKTQFSKHRKYIINFQTFGLRETQIKYVDVLEK